MIHGHAPGSPELLVGTGPLLVGTGPFLVGTGPFLVAIGPLLVATGLRAGRFATLLTKPWISREERLVPAQRPAPTSRKDLKGEETGAGTEAGTHQS